MTVKINSDKDTELHHRDVVNQNLRAGQQVRIGNGAKREYIRGEVGEFVKYTDILVEIGGVNYQVVTNSLEMPDKDTQRLKPGDEVTVGQGTNKPHIRWRRGKFVQYVRTVVNIDGAEYGLSPNSVERV